MSPCLRLMCNTSTTPSTMMIIPMTAPRAMAEVDVLDEDDCDEVKVGSWMNSWLVLVKGAVDVARAVGFGVDSRGTGGAVVRGVAVVGDGC